MPTSPNRRLADFKSFGRIESVRVAVLLMA